MAPVGPLPNRELNGQEVSMWSRTGRLVGSASVPATVRTISCGQGERLLFPCPLLLETLLSWEPQVSDALPALASPRGDSIGATPGVAQALVQPLPLLPVPHCPPQQWERRGLLHRSRSPGCHCCSTSTTGLKGRLRMSRSEREARCQKSSSNCQTT